MRTKGPIRLSTFAVVALITGGCGEAGLNQTAPLGGSTAGNRGAVEVVFINNTPHRAVFTVGAYDQTDPSFEPDFIQFGQGPSGRILDGDETSAILPLACARVFSVGGPNLLSLIESNLPDAEVDADAFIEGVEFFDVPSAEDDTEAEPVSVGTAPPLEALIGVDFPCGALLIVRFEFDDVGPDPFRIGFELVPSETTR